MMIVRFTPQRKSGLVRRRPPNRSTHPIMKKIFSCLLALPFFSGGLRAAELVVVHIDDTAITIPAPANFAAVKKDEMAALDQALEMFVAPQNRRLASFIPETFVPAARRGTVPSTSRTLSVQTVKKDLGLVTKSDFAEFKDAVRNQNSELMKKAEQELPGILDAANRKINGQFNTNLAMKFGGMVPLPPHDESDRSLTFSMLVHFAVQDGTGKSRDRSGYVTSTFMHIRGKILFLYVNGDETELEWTRQLSKEWAASIIAANPSDAATAAREAETHRRGFDWNQVLRSALIGGGVGAVIGLIRHFTRRKKAE